MEIIILKYTSFNKGKENKSFFVKQIGQKLQTFKNLNFLDKTKKTTIISFDYSNIINEIELNDNINFIDIEALKRQLIGRSKNEFKSNSKPWDIWNIIDQLNPNNFSLDKKEFEKNINNAKAVFLGINSEKINVSKIYSFVLDCIEKIYLDLKNEISTSNEKERFEKIECKLNNILFDTFKKGIKIDGIKVNKHIEDINTNLYSVKNELQLEYGIFSMHDYGNIKNSLCKEFPWFAEIEINTREFWKIIKLQKEKSRLVELIYLEKKLTKNKSILSRMGLSKEKRTHPIFDYFGTITGRIIVSSPSLQNLNKEYRDVVIPDTEKELIYIDYCQFEAGILAHEADDSKLIEMYNENDIYSEISKKLGVENVSRDLAKKLFFSYCYGMSKENILKYSGYNLNAFFEEFESLEKYENKLVEEFIRDGYVETILGNRRYRSNDNLENKKEGWLISQRIQGIASLILKEVIIEINNTEKSIEFLLPMHDAVLYQVPTESIVYCKDIIEKAFVKGLKTHFEKLKPKTSDKKFTE